jgi:hypothetical protein
VFPDSAAILGILISDIAGSPKGCSDSFLWFTNSLQGFLLSQHSPREVFCSRSGTDESGSGFFHEEFSIFLWCVQGSTIHAETCRCSDMAGASYMHIPDGGGKVIECCQLLYHKAVGQKALINDLNNLMVAVLRPDSPVVFAVNFHCTLRSLT